jgi:hypothetical protein
MSYKSSLCFSETALLMRGVQIGEMSKLDYLYVCMFSNICITMQIDDAGRINIKLITESMSKFSGIKDPSTMDKISSTCGESTEGKLSFSD